MTYRRPDGRRPDELRPVTIETGVVMHAEGSALIRMGNTVVLCNATVQEDVPHWLRGQGRGWVTAEYALLPRSTQTRTPRERSGARGRTQEIQRLIGRALRASVDLEALGERQIIIDADVIQADGGTRTAAITGGYVALVLALRKLVEAGEVSARVFRPAVAAVSVGVVEGTPLLDLSYEEDVRADVDMNVVMNAVGEFVEIQGTAEGMTFSRATLDTLLDLAWKGIQELLRIQQEAIRRTQPGG
ncbi:MAG: ribonuclease PH [Chloroflexi bacterium]|nr:ribonuclease PH [Chloroflexota bacterium]